jgi:hypothetical protein
MGMLAAEIFACLCARRIENYAQTTFIDFHKTHQRLTILMGFVIALRDFSDCTFMDAVFVFEKLSISNNFFVKVKAGKKKKSSLESENVSKDSFFIARRINFT